MECSVPTNWPSESARHSGVRTTSICPSPKMSPDRALATSIGTGKYVLLHDVWTAENSAAALQQTRMLCHSLVESIKSRHDMDVNIGIGMLARSISELRMSYHDAWGGSTAREAAGQEPANIPSK